MAKKLFFKYAAMSSGKSVALLAVTKTISEEQRADDVRKDDIAKLLSMIEESAKKDPNFRGINVNQIGRAHV